MRRRAIGVRDLVRCKQYSAKKWTRSISRCRCRLESANEHGTSFIDFVLYDESVRAVTDELISIPISGEVEAGKSIKFWPFRPTSFRHIRLTLGISDAEYIQMFGATTKDQFGEGSSGAFMF
ncbi:hypothetical protein PsorP6_014478 [Peronosclerospora sorghi]|uniref:Uncharacterized protein n=1 Tax=Peronosclerospora sorghi TaxID=230839 RepID=A0ACC0VT35_9STRA|nr:hypothetical protein PsorP6_014478 [Peronosclerospora sorghi]